MRKWLWLLLTVPCWAQYSSVPMIQAVTGGSTTTTSTCTFPRNVTSGNIGVVLSTSANSKPVTSISDTLTSTFTSNLSNTANPAAVSVYTTTFGSSGADTITVVSASGFHTAITCIEVSPTVMTTTVDASAVNSYGVSSPTITAPNVTTNKNGDLVFTFFANQTNGAPLYVATADLPRGWAAGSINNSGQIFSLVSVAGAPGTFTGITAQNPSSAGSGTNVTIAFAPPSLAIQTPSALPDGIISTAYSYTMLATGGVSTYTWSITSGTLPSGLSLNASTGAITGTIGAGASNNYSLTFQVTDGTTTVTKAVTLKVGATGNTPAFVQGKGSTVSITSLTFTSNVTSGNLLVVHGGWFGTRNFGYCTDSLGTVFNLVSATWVVNQSFNNLWAGFAPSTGADTITCDQIEQIQEFSGIQFSDVSNYLGATATSGTTLSTGTLTTLVPNEMLVMSCDAHNASSMTINSPFTQTESTTTARAKTGYDAATTVTGYSGTCTSGASNEWSTNLIGFRPSAGAVVITATGGPCLFVICQQ